jgi:hypothetical protein
MACRSNVEKRVLARRHARPQRADAAAEPRAGIRVASRRGGWNAGCLERDDRGRTTGWCAGGKTAASRMPEYRAMLESTLPDRRMARRPNAGNVGRKPGRAR